MGNKLPINSVSLIKRKTGADPGFPVGGSANHPEGGANLRYCQHFPKKLHEIAKILGRRGGAGRGRPPQIRHWKMMHMKLIAFKTARCNRTLCNGKTLLLTGKLYRGQHPPNPGVWTWRPPSQTPQLPSLGVGLETHLARPLNLPQGVGLEKKVKLSHGHRRQLHEI